MAKLNKECILCKTKYSFCNRCEAYDHLPRWMAIYCSDNCRTVFTTATDYEYKHLSKEDAKNILDSCDLSARDKYHPTTQRIIDEIYADNTEIKEEIKSDHMSEVCIATDDCITSCSISISDNPCDMTVSLTNSANTVDTIKTTNTVNEFVSSVEKVRNNNNKKMKSKKKAAIEQE